MATKVSAVPECPEHHRPLVMFCPACRGSKGGQTVTRAKRKHLRAIAPLGNAARWPGKKKKAPP